MMNMIHPFNAPARPEFFHVCCFVLLCAMQGISYRIVSYRTVVCLPAMPCCSIELNTALNRLIDFHDIIFSFPFQRVRFLGYMLSRPENLIQLPNQVLDSR